HRPRHDQETAHGGRACLLEVGLGTVLADDLACPQPLQPPDEGPAQHKGDGEGKGRRVDDGGHRGPSSPSPSSRWATRSSARPREALMRTTSPGSTSAATRSAAAAASGQAAVRSAGKPAATAAAITVARHWPTATSQSTPASAAWRPTSSWAASLHGPSSSISPRTATRRAPWTSRNRTKAAAMDAGLAL